MVILLMGTTGAGKTTIGTRLARELGWTFLDADDYHPAPNIEKMSKGIPLADEDRAPWLAAIHAELLRRTALGENVVLGCSALKQKYREVLSAGLAMKIIYLKGSYDEMLRHIQGRLGHFAGAAILAGQFADLEEPRDAIVVDVSKAPDEIIAELRGRLRPPVA